MTLSLYDATHIHQKSQGSGLEWVCGSPRFPERQARLRPVEAAPAQEQLLLPRHLQTGAAAGAAAAATVAAGRQAQQESRAAWLPVGEGPAVIERKIKTVSVDGQNVAQTAAFLTTQLPYCALAAAHDGCG